MADTKTHAELQKDEEQFAAQEQQFAAQEQQFAAADWLVASLIFGGVFVAVFAEWFGTLYAQSSGTNGSWSPDTAHEAAAAFRTLGVLSFFGGLTERVILVIQSKQSK